MNVVERLLSKLDSYKLMASKSGYLRHPKSCTDILNMIVF